MIPSNCRLLEEPTLRELLVIAACIDDYMISPDRHILPCDTDLLVVVGCIESEVGKRVLLGAIGIVRNASSQPLPRLSASFICEGA